MANVKSVKTCWIASVKRELGITRGKAPNNKGYKVPPPPSEIANAIREVIKEIMETENRIPTYREIQRKVIPKLEFPKADPFLNVDKWAVDTGIRELSEEFHKYAEEEV